jgi:uncharacterized protein (TIGR03435 family)
MMRHLLTFVIAIVMTAVGAAQTGKRFEVASIRPSPEQPPAQGVAGLTITQQQVRFSWLSLKDYLGIAYELPVHRISAPDWVASTRFEIAATIPADATTEQLDEMMQALLTDRFQLKAHHEKREFSVYALEVAAGGPPLVRLPDDIASDAPITVASQGSGNGVAVDLGQGASLTFMNNRFEVKKVTMAMLADTLGRFVDRPVVDLTKLEGRYDIAFDVAPEEYQPMLIRSAVNAGIALPPQALRLLDTASNASVLDGLKKMGLSLQSRREPLDVLVVDSMQRMPTEN